LPRRRSRLPTASRSPARRTERRCRISVSAQETLRTLVESQARQQRIVDLTQAGVTAGDLPRVEVTRARARAERVNTAVSDARAAVVAARVGLADTVGVSLDDLAGAPQAADAFATVPAAAPSAEGLVGRALTNRLDIRAAQSQRAAADVLAAGARANQRRTFDFQITGGLTNIYDSPIYKFLPDEVSPIIPPPAPLEDPLHYYSWRGFYRAIEKRWEPYVVAQMTMRLPFGNNSAKGAYKKAAATATGRRIDAEDLSRRVQANVVDVADQVRQSLESVRRWESAVRNNDDLLAGSLERFQSRDITLVDALLTEEAVTSDRLQLVRQRQNYFSLLARLKYEAGELVDVGTGEAAPESIRFDPSAFVSR
jgi:outer membrane protein TolC